MTGFSPGTRRGDQPVGREAGWSVSSVHAIRQAGTLDAVGSIVRVVM